MPGQTVVVLAEDEALVRTAAAEALRDDGFEVMEARHAEDALGILSAYASTVHLLFTDIEMPGTMDGLALAHYTARSWPWIGLLIASGRARPHRAALPVMSHFLRKPYTHHHVVSHIRELIGP